METEYLTEVSSTQDYIRKYLESGKDITVFAYSQTCGKGTKGRGFVSHDGGVYLSQLKFYENFSAKDSFLIMMQSAVAVCRTIEAFGGKPQIKWPNDILLNGKKVCGILIENVLAGNEIRASIVGIGLNVCNDISEVAEIACSLKQALGFPFSPPQVRERLRYELARASVYTYEDYAPYLHFLGREVTVIEGERAYQAVARGVLPDGRLEIESEGEKRVLSSAEISLRLS